jgi:hypothetical protein
MFFKVHKYRGGYPVPYKIPVVFFGLNYGKLRAFCNILYEFTYRYRYPEPEPGQKISALDPAKCCRSAGSGTLSATQLLANRTVS